MMVSVSSVVPSVSPVTTVQAATKIKLNKTKATLYVGDSVKLKVSGTKKKVTWKSSSKSVATVSSKGVVKAKKQGSTTITATVSKKKYTCKVTVKPSFTAEETSISIKTDAWETVKITKAQRTDESIDLSYSIEDTSIVSCELDGEDVFLDTELSIYGIKAGSTTITIRNLKTNEEIVIYVVVNDDFSVSSDVITNLVTLRRYINTYGSTNADGNKFIKSELNGYSGAIVYKESDYTFDFIFAADNGSVVGNMTIDIGDNVRSTTYTQYLTSSYSFSITTTIDPASYNPNKTYSFTFVENASPFKISSVQKVGNTGMAAAFSYWQLTLIENLSMKLGDIGFTAY
jgi:hypothetical protein